jgi:hypothetical protein
MGHVRRILRRKFGARLLGSYEGEWGWDYRLVSPRAATEWPPPAPSFLTFSASAGHFRFAVHVVASVAHDAPPYLSWTCRVPAALVVAVSNLPLRATVRVRS